MFHLYISTWCHIYDLLIFNSPWPWWTRPGPHHISGPWYLLLADWAQPKRSPGSSTWDFSHQGMDILDFFVDQARMDYHWLISASYTDWTWISSGSLSWLRLFRKILLPQLCKSSQAARYRVSQPCPDPKDGDSLSGWHHVPIFCITMPSENKGHRQTKTSAPKCRFSIRIQWIPPWPDHWTKP